jgi:hypothetical protein
MTCFFTEILGLLGHGVFFWKLILHLWNILSLLALIYELQKVVLGKWTAEEKHVSIWCQGSERGFL